ncbi:YciI family protein [Gaiella sp.]|uniref:YciI family protein n=1 Tax=Gaiella sp. TaxID=2663207 RepID=UPI003267440E
MTRYLISFPSGAMDHIPVEEMPAVGEAAHAVVREAMDAGVLVFGGGLAADVDPVMVAGDGTITAGTYPQTTEFDGGFTILDAPSREAALEWAAKLAAACRCAQEIREFGADAAVGN